MADENDLQPILDLAKELGEKVAELPAIKKYADAQKALTEDPEAGKLLEQFQQKLATVARNQQHGQPVTAAERQELETLQTTLASNLRFKAYTVADYEMTDTLRKISQAWQKPVAEAQGANGDNPMAASRLSMSGA